MKNNIAYVKLLHQLAQIPRNMINNHHKDNITEFVLHDLCKTNCFNITKAAYLVNNKDFKCLRGIAGFYQPEAFPAENAWNDSEKFSAHMQNASFNKKVRAVNRENLSANENNHPETLMQAIGNELDLENPQVWTANLKHDNIGVLIYEKPRLELTDYLSHGFSFLGLCPLF